MIAEAQAHKPKFDEEREYCPVTVVSEHACSEAEGMSEHDKEGNLTAGWIAEYAQLLRQGSETFGETASR